MKVLITGVAGLLGSRLADWIIENTDYHVVGVDDLSGGYMDNVHEEVESHQVVLILPRVFTQGEHEAIEGPNSPWRKSGSRLG